MIALTVKSFNYVSSRF